MFGNEDKMEAKLDGTLTINDFIEKLGSKEPVPGGGGAAALAASIGVSLCKMAVNYTVGKKKYADVEDIMQETLKRAGELAFEFIDIIDEDAKGFYPLSQAYGLPAETDEQKAEKAVVLERELKNATTVPLKLMEKCCEAIDLSVLTAEKGSKLMVSDAACAISTCESALRCASLNVFINTKLMKNREVAEEINAKALSMLEEYCGKADEAFDKVKNGMFA